MPVLPHELKVGVDVYSADGEKLGKLHRLVLRRSDLAVTHVVVDIGFLRSGRPLWAGGFGLDYDRIVGIEEVASADDQRVELSMTAAAFGDAPEYTTESFEAPQDLSPDEFDIPDVVNRAQGLAAIVGSTSNTWIFEKLNRPLDSVDIAEGTDVWRREPHQKLGEVRRVIMDEGGARVRAFVIHRGFLLTHDVVLPARYVAELYDDVVRVDISDAELAQLQRYEGD
jgi:uncharacterized protein YrrD